MRTKVTLVLVFLNVVLFGYVFYYERPMRTRLALLEARRAVLPPEVAGMETFTRTSEDGTVVSAEKRADGWWLTKPYEWPLNPNALSRIHNELQFARNETKFRVADLAATGQTLADYGLERPALTFAFRAGGREFVLRVGNPTTAGNRLYVLGTDGEYVHVVNRSLAESLGLGLAELRSESIITIPVFEVRSLGVQTATVKTRLRRDATRWMFETPILARANKSEVELAVNALINLRAHRFFEPRDPALERAGLAQPALRVTLEGNSRRETLLIGSAAPPPPAAAGEPGTEHYFARLEDKDAVFSTAIPTALLEKLRGAQEELRERRVLDFERRNVSSITLASPGAPELSLQRLEAAAAGSPAPDAWQVVARAADGQAPAPRPADREIVEQLLQKLEALAARRFVSDAPSAADLEGFGFNRPERQVSLAFAARPAEPTAPTGATLLIGTTPERRDAAFARVGHAPYVYEVSPEILRDTPVDLLHYRERILRKLPEGGGARLVGLRLARADGAEPLYERRLDANDSGWNAAIAGEPEPRRGAIAALVRALDPLVARRFVSESFSPAGAEVEGSRQPWAYRLDVTLALVGGNGAVQHTDSTLHLTPRLGGTTQVAGTEDFGGVTFELTQEMIDALFTLTNAERDPGPPPAPVPGG